VVFFLLRHWWLGALALAVPACLVVMQAAGLKLGRATCVGCRTKRWMVRATETYRCDGCEQKRAEAAAEQRRLFNTWSWNPFSDQPMPEGWEPSPPQSGFSTQHPLPFSDRSEPSPPPSSQYRLPGK
jgi:hypothetical protein